MRKLKFWKRQKSIDTDTIRQTEARIQQEMEERRVKFDFAGDYYIRYTCLQCKTEAFQDDETVEVTSCPSCGPTELWKVYGSKWVYSHVDEFWTLMDTTNDVKVPVKFRDWLVGQKMPLRRTMLEVRRWGEKVKTTQEMYKKGIDPSGVLKENPGPYVLFVSEPGTGKSLLIKIIAEEMEDLYATLDIELSDQLTIENKMDRYRPLVREVPAGLAGRIIKQAERSALNEQKEKQQVIFMTLTIMMALGGALLLWALFIIALLAMAVGIFAAWSQYMSMWLPLMIPGMLLLVFPMMLVMFRSGSFMGVNQKELMNVPHLLVDNGPGRKLVVNCNITNAPTLFGDIKWNAYGDTPGLTPPLHTRVVAGDVHKGHFKLLYIDEIRNLPIHLAVEFLTVMEDNETPIRAHSGGGMGNAESSSILAVATADPVPCNFMMICAGNMDIMFDPRSTINQVPAFRDRFNYGDIIYFETHMDASPENEIKVVQVVTDEIYRFRLKPMHKDGVRRLIEYMRARADNNKKLKVMWRYAIKVLIKSHELALEKNVPVLTGDIVDEAINVFCRSLEQQAMDEQLGNRQVFKLIKNTGTEHGQINGLAVVGNPGPDGRSAGSAFPVVAAVLDKTTDVERRRDTFFVTGVLKDAQSWVQDSVIHVRTAIYKMYGFDPGIEKYINISFAQHGGKDNFVEGPSAGVAMTLAIMSSLGDPRLPPEKRKPIPIRQDVAVTGTIELIPTPGEPKNVRVGAIGGVPDKIEGAVNNGIRYVIVPMENFEHTLTGEKYPCEVYGADSILGYYDLVRGDEKSLIGIGKPKTDEDIRLWAAEKARKKVTANAP